MHLVFESLGVLDLGTDSGARSVLGAVHDAGASAADRERLITLILRSAPAADRQHLEDLMTTTEWKSDFVESFVNVGRQEGRQEGAIEAKAESILKVLAARDLKPTTAQRDQVAAATDLSELDRWFDRALTVATADEVFAD